MSTHLHDPKNPRHKRLFELLYQENLADSVVGRVKGFQVRKVDKEELDEIKRVAAMSFGRSQ